MQTPRRNIVLLVLFFVVFVAMFVFEALGVTRHVEQDHPPLAWTTGADA